MTPRVPQTHAGAVAVGSIVDRPVYVDDRFEAREHICLTLSFDHDLIDGAPAARFTQRLAALLAGGDLLAHVPS